MILVVNSVLLEHPNSNCQEHVNFATDWSAWSFTLKLIHVTLKLLFSTSNDTFQASLSLNATGTILQKVRHCRCIAQQRIERA